MAALVLTDAGLWLGKYSFAGSLAAVSLNLKSDALDSTVFSSGSYRSNIVGLKGFGFDARGFWDATLDLGLSGFLSGAIITITPQTSVGAAAYLGTANATEYGQGDQVGSIAPFRVSGMGTSSSVSVGLVRGELQYNGTLGATANSTGSQIGALSSTQRMVANLHVIAASGTTPTLDVTVQSDDNSGFTSATTRATFAQKIIAGSEQKIITGAVTDDYWRFRFVIGGTSPSFTVVASIGRI